MSLTKGQIKSAIKGQNDSQTINKTFLFIAEPIRSLNIQEPVNSIKITTFKTNIIDFI